MRVGVITFPGSNCDDDCLHAIALLRHEAIRVWHQEESLKNLDALILPGGFSYGDYLRTGAIARFSPVMPAVKRFAEEGKPVLGICNGFQILLEAGLLPGVMLRNESLKFICKPVELKLENNRTPFTRNGEIGKIFTLPIAHAEGNYFADAETLKRLEQNRQVVFRYAGKNPNGSLREIAGICNEKGNVVGLMPHPERRMENLLGGEDGRFLFESLVEGRT